MTERPRIALVAHGIHDNGGMERAFFELVRRSHRDYRFVVFASELDPSLRPFVEWRRIRVPMRPIPLKTVLFSLFAGARLMTTRRTLVHTNGALVPNRTDIATVHFCSAGFVGRTGQIAPPGGRAIRRVNTALTRLLGIALERWCYRNGRARTLAAVSRGVAAELSEHYPGVPVALTPNGVDVARFRPDPVARHELRKEEGVGEEELILLFVGGDWDRKGLELLLDGASRSGIDARVWIVGRGDVDRFAARAHAAGVQARFFGPRDDVESFFAAADIFVLPTLYETFSLVAYEAAAAGLPVVATRVNGIDELLEDERAGLFVERDASSIAGAVRRLADDAPLRLRLGEEGRLRASAYDWRRSVDSVLDLYRALAPTRNGSTP